MIVCYNGRLEWVPFLNNFQSLQTFQEFYRKWATTSPTDNSSHLLLDFDKAEYKFSEESALKFIKDLRFLPLKINSQEKLEIYIGNSFHYVRGETFLELIKVTENKLNLIV